jgi:hypothetical protein
MLFLILKVGLIKKVVLSELQAFITLSVRQKSLLVSKVNEKVLSYLFMVKMARYNAKIAMEMTLEILKDRSHYD